MSASRPAHDALMLARRIEDRLLALRARYGQPGRPDIDAARRERHETLIIEAWIEAHRLGLTRDFVAEMAVRS